MDRWTTGRTALIGDAAACVSLLAGEGSGLAMAEAYVLAGELRNCGGDYNAAFARYQQRLMPLLKRKQTVGGEIRFVLCPENSVRHYFPQSGHAADARLPFVMDFFIGRELRDQVQLPDYGF